MIKPPSIRLVLSLVVSRNWPLRQLDVNNAFLQGHLKELVYMEQPPGFVDSEKPDHVCKLNKAISALKQAPRVWYNELRTFLLQNGFVNALADTSLFVLFFQGTVLFFLVYVDDIIITRSCSTRIQKLIELLGEMFSLEIKVLSFTSLVLRSIVRLLVESSLKRSILMIYCVGLTC